MGRAPGDGFVRRPVGRSARIVVLPALPSADAAQEAAARRAALAAPGPASSLGTQHLSTRASAPASTMAGKAPMDALERERLRMAAASRLPPAPVQSSVGPQRLSHRRSAPSASVGAGPSRAQASDMQLKEASAVPSAATYGNPSTAGLSTVMASRSAVMPRMAAQIDDPMTRGRPVPGLGVTAMREAAARPGPGHYRPGQDLGVGGSAPSLGPRGRNKTELPVTSAAASRAFALGVAGAGREHEMESRLRFARYAAAQDKRQPATPRKTRH